MTPEEKAEELVVKYASLHITTIGCTDNSNPCVVTNVMFKDNAKQCALIAVDEIIDSMSRYDDLVEEDLKREFGIEFFSCEVQNMDGDFRYWQQVKQEIEKL